MERKLLFIGDGVAPTGFSTVIHNIIKNLPDNYKVHHLAVNFHGDPHPYKHKIYPAGIGGDIWGFNRIESFGQNKFDAIFILNDLWVVSRYLEQIKQTWKTIPPIIVYYPVDAEEFDNDWFKHFDIVTIPVVYTEFGKRVSEKASSKDLNFRIIPHGVDTTAFHKIEKERARDTLFKDFPELSDSFVVLNANRNQPRKRLDIALEGFKLFAENKKNVYYYHHAGLQDAGWNIPKLVSRHSIDDKILTTNQDMGMQRVPVNVLNLVYNVADVGLNTSLGEGWGLTNVEHAITGAPQIVPDSSACSELFADCGLLIPIATTYTYEQTLTVGKVVAPEAVAQQLDIIYSSKDLYNILSTASTNKFMDKKYSWKTIGNQFKELFEELWVS